MPERLWEIYCFVFGEQNAFNWVEKIAVFLNLHIKNHYRCSMVQTKRIIVIHIGYFRNTCPVFDIAHPCISKVASILVNVVVFYVYWCKVRKETLPVLVTYLFYSEVANFRRARVLLYHRLSFNW